MKVGILGCGRIAAVMAETISKTEGVTLEAVAAREISRAEEFKAEYGASKAYGSYEELCADPDVELVYIATVSSLHKEHMLLAIEQGKSVLCEKPFCVNAKEAEEVFCKAAEKGVLAAEAIWTRYMPSRVAINEIIASGRIGEVKSISANLSYDIAHKPRIATPALGGGALLDIGVYPINFALMVEEGHTLEKIAGTAVLNEQGADLADSLTLVFDDGVQAVLFSDARTCSDRKGIIYGSEGCIEVENINNPEKIRIYSANRPPFFQEEVKLPNQISGYEYELLSCKSALENGETEVPEMPRSETMRVLRLMDAFRAVWGVKLGSELDETDESEDEEVPEELEEEVAEEEAVEEAEEELEELEDVVEDAEEEAEEIIEEVEEEEIEKKEDL